MSPNATRPISSKIFIAFPASLFRAPGFARSASGVYHIIVPSTFQPPGKSFRQKKPGWRSAARMEFAVNRHQTAPVHMGVDLGRADIRVAEHLLDHPQIGAVGEQMAGK